MILLQFDKFQICFANQESNMGFRLHIDINSSNTRINVLSGGLAQSELNKKSFLAGSFSFMRFPR